MNDDANSSDFDKPDFSKERDFRAAYIDFFYLVELCGLRSAEAQVAIAELIRWTHETFLSPKPVR